MRVSTRGTVDPFIVMEIMNKAAEAEATGRRIIHMEVGQPGTPAPKAALASVEEALTTSNLGYSITQGLPELRQGISELNRDWYGVDLDPDRIIITSGASGAFSLAFASLFDPGERVGMGAPGYPSYRQILKAMALEPVVIETSENARYQPRPDDLDGQGLDGLIVASPGNPSGTMLDHAALSALMARAQADGTAFISDEIYHGLTYDGRAVSALEVSDEAYVINSFSKYFSMTGWRVGWMVVPEDHVQRVERLAQHMFICAPHVSQVAALAALEAREEMDENLAVYARNRALLLDRLPKIGFDRIAPPDGAFYVYADVSNLTDDSFTFAADLLDKAGVAVTPGLDFDARRGGGTLRLSYAAATEDIEEGLDRIERFLAAGA